MEFPIPSVLSLLMFRKHEFFAQERCDAGKNVVKQYSYLMASQPNPMRGTSMTNKALMRGYEP